MMSVESGQRNGGRQNGQEVGTEEEGTAGFQHNMHYFACYYVTCTNRTYVLSCESQ